jgi:Flp pilus assembly protein TadG
MVGALLLLLFMGVIQVGLFLYVRNVVAANAAEGARHAANLGVPASDGGPYAERLIHSSVPGGGRGITCTGAQVAGNEGLVLVQVTCRGRVPLSVVPLGPSVALTVTGHAVKEADAG